MHGQTGRAMDSDTMHLASAPPIAFPRRYNARTARLQTGTRARQVPYVGDMHADDAIRAHDSATNGAARAPVSLCESMYAAMRAHPDRYSSPGTGPSAHATRTAASGTPAMHRAAQWRSDACLVLTSEQAAEASTVAATATPRTEAAMFQSMSPTAGRNALRRPPEQMIEQHS